MSIYLCGNTGFVNRGCEAIAISTVSILPFPKNDIFLTSYKPEEDTKVADRLGVTIIPYGTYPTPIHRIVCGTVKRILPFTYCGANFIEKELFASLKKGDVCLNIGGDTYCYGRPVNSFALNRFTSRRVIRNILWCCSVGRNNLTRESVRDLKKYDLIFAREKLTYDMFREEGFPEESVVKCCDPAFFLNAKETELPAGFIAGNTVGINVSDLVIKQRGDICYRSTTRLIEYIIKNTNMNVCLIPHVYRANPATIDLKLLSQIHEDIKSDRVSLIDKELGCEQLKYIISKCRFMIASRTHASIAAYSSYVPTLVIGYSVKSLGIATDLFGSHEGYVIPYSDIKDDTAITEVFKKIEANEDIIKKRLHSFVPQYRDSLTEAIGVYLKPENIS